MRIVSWNVNGLRTLKGFQPWYKLPSWEACLEELHGDIVCFQEMKMTRKQLQYAMCVMDAYEGFFDLHPTKGYSGTATYVRKAACMPIDAEIGITGRLPSRPIGGQAATDGVDAAIVPALDSEGRSVILDCGLFVLINVYAPNETGPERLEYKMGFHRVLEARIQALQRLGRQVILVGDLNAVGHPIDHCEGKNVDLSKFLAHPARAWLRSLTNAEEGSLVDTTRTLHPDREKMFTCWNTLIDARPANYGVRLDYILITPGLLPWVKAADIQPGIYGSDHCPVFLELHDAIEKDGTLLHLADLMHGTAGMHGAIKVPSLAASRLEPFCAQAQPRLVAMFGAQRASKNNAVVAPVQTTSKHATVPRAIPKKAPASKGQPNLLEFFGGGKRKETSPPGGPNQDLESPSKQLRLASLLVPVPRETPPKAAAQWDSIFTPQPPPLCSMHNEPAKACIVNKPGVNQGRKFWLCARPVGPGYEKGGRAEPSLTYRCNYFAWDSDVKRSRKPKR
ncbi:Apn2p [Malassezia vespertilionis]|uniref:DNA-(apurinic or apyrimidinic site) endonuclease n=1 Tax=Malassezia vespertilionis TaxID=2020962 RepID=A0A2N1J7M0_9BASI|nr:Apn2p [Malassezia vespertilionis]